jgi:uncharacterized delta-60 repeat protein
MYTIHKVTRSAAARLLLAGLMTILLATAAAAAGGDLDPAFNVGLGPDGAVWDLALQPDGKFLVGGGFNNFGGAQHRNIARVNADGSLDTSFNGDTNATIYSLALQPDGKVLIGGDFSTADGASRGGLARLNSDGSLDTSFGVGIQLNSVVDKVIPLPSGKIFIAGQFTTINNVTRNRVARLNSDGTLDASFDPGVGSDGWVNAAVLQPDGRIVIGGQFLNYAGTARAGVARINPDGSLDASLDPGAGVAGSNHLVRQMVLQSDGKIVMVGDFGTYGGFWSQGVARINSNGSLDFTFPVGQATDSNTVRAIGLQPDGRVVIGGDFPNYNGTGRRQLVRLNKNGSLDATFDAGSATNGLIFALALQPDGKVVIGGTFTTYKGATANRVARLLPAPGAISFTQPGVIASEGDGFANFTVKRSGGADGATVAHIALADVTTSRTDYSYRGGLDTSFDAGNGTDGLITAVAVQPDDKVIVAGTFFTINGVSRPYVGRLTRFGGVDFAFNTGFGPNAPVNAIALQPDGKILIGGDFTNFNNITRNRVARLNADGTLDNSFDPGMGPNASVYGIAVQPDGKILIVGDFGSVGGSARERVARLNSDGSLDASFDAGNLAHNEVRVHAVAVQPDGKILFGATLLVQSLGFQGIARVNADGSRDSSFMATDALGVNDMVLQPDGKIVIVGTFPQVNDVGRNCIARLNSDGTLDTSFDPGTGTDIGPNGGGGNGITSVAMQPDGKMVVGGTFDVYNGTTRNGVARVNADGTLDTLFDPGAGPGGPFGAGVNDVALQSNGRVIIAGGFTNVGGVPRIRVAGLMGDLFVAWANGDSTDKTVSLPIVNDLLDEADETATLTLELISGAASLGSQKSLTLTIADNDTPPAFTSTLPPATAPTRIVYTHNFTASGSPAATFALTSGTLPPGLTLSSSGLLTGTPTTVGTYSNITVTASNGVAPAATQTFSITVLDGGLFKIASPTYTVNEADGSVTVTVERTGGNAGSAEVNYFTSNGTANSLDYTQTSGKLTFADGETSKTVAVPITNDSVNERDETFAFNLGTVAGSATLGTPTTAVVTITNDDPLPTLSVEDVTVIEGDVGTKFVNVKVTLTGLIDRQVFFTGATADGTAVAGEDYVGGVGGYSIFPGATSANVPVILIGDTLTEGDENFVINLSGVGDATIARAQGTFTIKDNETTTGLPTVQLSMREYKTSEAAGVVTVTVTRSGDTSTPTNVSYSTSPLLGTGFPSADDRRDYNLALGTLQFAAGELNKSFDVFITDDTFVEGDEVLLVALTNATGGIAIGAPGSSVIRITDNDTVTSSTNPLNDSTFFVKQHYRDFLNREPDAPGLAFWVNEVEKCGTDQQCRDVRRVNVSAAFFLSIEFQQTGYLVYRLHKTAFNTGERLPLRTFIADTQSIGRSVIVGQGDWQAQLEANKVAFIDAFMQRPEFASAFPQTMTPAQFVDALNANTGDPLNPSVGGSLTQAERDQLVADLTSGAKTRAQVLRVVAENPEFQRRQFNKAFVYMQYVGYMRRGPGEAPDSNFDGYNFWLGKLNQFNGNFVQAEMVKAFISSDEYRHRFGL